eukprot:COSAG05_NODE_344_length_11005_cov_35.313772_15_plen_98_part_00
MRFADFKALQTRLDCASKSGEMLHKVSAETEAAMPALVRDMEYYTSMRERETTGLEDCWPAAQRQLDETTAELLGHVEDLLRPTVRVTLAPHARAHI